MPRFKIHRALPDGFWWLIGPDGTRHSGWLTRKRARAVQRLIACYVNAGRPVPSEHVCFRALGNL